MTYFYVSNKGKHDICCNFLSLIINLKPFAENSVELKFIHKINHKKTNLIQI